MATGPVERVRDEASDYEDATDDVERPESARSLDERVDGEVRFDSYSRQWYATDASLYEVTPVGVVFPRETPDVAAVLSSCAGAGVAVLPRGGRTSVAGQTVNEAVVIDFTTHMASVREVDPDGRRVRAHASVLLSDPRSGACRPAPDPLTAPRPADGTRTDRGGA